MGININTLKALSLLSSYKKFDNQSIITLGRQNVSFTTNQLRSVFSSFTVEQCKRITASVFADPLFQQLGFSTIHSMDYSDFEGAQLLHDLNKPIAEQHKNTYDVVMDGGTLEHVFNFPVAIDSCMKLVKKNGHLIMVTPSNNLFGHGFYQFSPELFYRIFSEENGFAIVEIFVNGKKPGTWYAVSDPRQVGERVVLQNGYATELIVIARKTNEAGGMLSTPQQSDYRVLWDKFSETSDAQATASYLTRQYKALVPKVLRDKIWKFRHQRSNPNLGRYYKSHFKRMW